jgi:VWFA-related protein
VKNWTLAMLFAGLPAVVAAAPRADAPRTFGETTSVVAVEVPVQVIVDGKPVRGLTRENFEVVDGRAKQEITGFEVVDLGGAPAAAGAAASGGSTVSTRRHFLFLFDLVFSEPEALVKARESARDVVRESLHASDLIAVATYTLAKGPVLVLGFTSDRNQALQAIDTLGKPEFLERNPDPLRIAVGNLDAGAGGGAGATGEGGRREAIAASLLEDLKEMAGRSERSNRQHDAARVTGLSRSFADLARLMGSVRGRKYVVYLSQGFDSGLLVGAEEGDSQETRSALESGEVWKVDSDERFGNTKTQGDLEKMLEEFRRADCVIQSVDISGVRAANDQRPRASGEAGLLMMAKDTGGDFYRNFNDLGEAMGQMLDRTSVTYVLTFQPDVKFDGNYHRLDVKLKNAPRGARLVHRPGYYAPKPFAERAGLERQLQAADVLFDGAEGGELDSTVLVAPFRAAASGKAYVPVLIEVSGATLLAGVSGGALSAEVYAYAFDAQGAVRDFVTQSIGLELAKAPPALKDVGLKFFGHFDLAPGDYTVRAFVRNGQTGASALRLEGITVSAAGAGAPRLLEPLFTEPFGRWMVVREVVPPGEPAAAYPFMLGDAPFVPSARPRLRHAAPAQVAVVGYDLPDGASFALDFQSNAGASVARVPIAAVQKLASEAGAVRVVGSVDAKAVAPGAYTVQLVATAGTAQVTSSPIAVEVASN